MKLYCVKSLSRCLVCLLLSLMHVSCSQTKDDDPCQYVDMRIGTGGHGHVFMGASVPYGMVQLGPTSIPQDWDWCSGYHQSDSTVIGFSHTHLSGTGIGDLFDVTVMPVVGEVTYARGVEDDMESGFWSYADRKHEVSRPGYYRVPLSRYGVDAELTATNRVGFHRYTYPEDAKQSIVFDLQNGGCWDRPMETHIDSVSPTRIEGFRHSRGWADDQKVYFVADFSKPISDFTIIDADERYARLDFEADSSQVLMLKVAISPVSVEGAMRNMDEELPGWNFDQTRTEAYNLWRNELGRIKIDVDDKQERTKFYTSLFHTMISPATFADVDGQYRGADGAIYKAEGYTPYTILSLWDTYRAALPLMSITQPDRYSDVINTMVDIADKQGRLPVWHLWGNETDCMVGNPGVIAVADALTKEVQGVDDDHALDVLIMTANDTIRGGGLRQHYGYIPVDMFGEAVAWDLEYAIADAAVAHAARRVGMDSIADVFVKRSKSYAAYFDPITRFLRGRLSDGSWRTPFDPFASSHRDDDYCEGNAWQYTWLVPHDVKGLAGLLGGEDLMVHKLDSLFTVGSVVSDDASPDISGLIGQYAHGNEPSHHIIYMFTMLGYPECTALRARQVMRDMYSVNPDGLSGNEDAGQMSAWYIMSALGLYQVEPGSARYIIGSPIVNEASWAVPGGTFTIKAHNNSPENIYIKDVKLNGMPYDNIYITHSDIMNGGVLELFMADTPNQYKQ